MEIALDPAIPTYSGGLGVLAGWWIEGCIEGITGWAIGRPADRRRHDTVSLYDTLQHKLIPLHYGDRKGFLSVMLHAIALNGSFFNTQRMVLQYVLRAYFR